MLCSADLHLKKLKRKREDPDLSSQSKAADDANLDEGEIPADPQSKPTGLSDICINASAFLQAGMF